MHPISRAILNYVEEKGIKYNPITQFKSIPGFGLEGTVDNQSVYIGKASYVKKQLNENQQNNLRLTTDEIAYTR